MDIDKYTCANAVDKIGVHRTHCCKRHGCKYGDANCPIENGTVVQDYPCESCGNDTDKLEDYIETFASIYNKLGIKKEDVDGKELVSDTILKHVEQLCTERDDLRNYADSLFIALQWAMDKEPSPCRCMDFATPPHMCRGHKMLELYKTKFWD